MRTHYCGQIDLACLDQEVTLCGWVHRRRDHGGILFIDLRDRAGLVQVVFDPEKPASFAVAERARGEYVLRVRGRVRRRPPGMENPGLPSGEVEVVGDELEILNTADPPPFQVDDCNVEEETRLRYRYIDLRRPQMQDNLRLRARVCRVLRRYLDDAGFVEIETPMLTRATPEGARDYLVPSRTHPGRFFALPQSPQLFKQLLMMSGLDRYYQIVRCFRDEDLRADRQPEFTQLDIETTFLDEGGILAIMEDMFRGLFQEVLGDMLTDPIPRMSFAECMRRFGTDRPDLRVPLELVDCADLVSSVEFTVFSGPANRPGARVAALRVPGAATLSRKALDDYATFVAGHGARGLAYIKVNDRAQGREGLQSPILKFLPDTAIDGILARTGAQSGDLIFFGADDARVVNDALGALRLKLGADLGLAQGGWHPLWVVDFPMFEWSKEEQRFSRPASSLHRPQAHRSGRANGRSPRLPVARLRPGPERHRDRRRLGAHPSPRDAGGRVSTPRHPAGRGAREVRFPPGGTPLRLSAARRDRLRPGPPGHADGRRLFDPGRDRLPQDPVRGLPADGRPLAGAGGAAPGAVHRHPQTLIGPSPCRNTPCKSVANTL